MPISSKHGKILMKLAFVGVAALLASCKPADMPVPEARAELRPETCADITACVARLRAIAAGRRGDPYGGMGPQEDMLASRLQAMPGVAEAMVPLLSDKDPGVAQLAAYVLRDVKQIDPKHLPAIRAGLDRDLGWLAPALVRIGTDEAAAEAVKRLLAQNDTGNQEGHAVVLFGNQAIPHIVAAARCRDGCKNPETHRFLASMLHEMVVDARLIVPELLAICEDPSVPDNTARGTLEMIGALKERALPWQDNVEALAKKRPALGQDVEEVLIAIHGDRAATLLVERLRRDPDEMLLRDIAALGDRGRSAAPDIEPLLKHVNPDLREMAAVALGHVGDEKNIPALLVALDDPTDVRLNLQAAEALGRMRALSAKPSLERAAKTHWHPWVRDAAKSALLWIPRPRLKGAPDRRTLFGFERRREIDCESPVAEYVELPVRLKSSERRGPGQLARLQYTATAISYGPPEGTAPNADGVVAVTESTMVRHEKAVTRTPQVALRTGDGWLAGSDRGEWGGELMWLGDDGKRYRIFDGNIQDIHRLGNRYVAVSGIAHMSTNAGALLDLSMNDHGRWHATSWRVLPGAPRSSGVTKQGELLVNTYEGGAVLVDAQGRMRMAECLARPSTE